MTSTTPDRSTRRATGQTRPESPTPAPPADVQLATGVAGGNLGTGTAIDEETTVMAVPDAPEPAAPPESAAPARAPETLAPVAAPRPRPTDRAAAVLAAREATAAPATTERRTTARRDPYRPIGIALAAILVALAGFAVLSSGGGSPIGAGAPPIASQTTAPDATDGGRNEDNGDDGGQKGKCNGRGNDPCDREGGDD